MVGRAPRDTGSVRPRIAVSRGATSNVAAYLDALRAVGAEPIEVGPEGAIPPFDALCLPGGPDVEPWRYGQEPGGSEKPDPARDELDLDRLLPEAVSRGVPVLAICRGLQVLNVFRGGTLVQDIGEAHRAVGDEVKPHTVRVEAGSRLAALCGPDLVVNSRHHQVIDRLGKGLRPVAWADRYLEAVEDPDEPWILAVQWHPERTRDGLPDNGVGVFEGLVEAAAAVRS